MTGSDRLSPDTRVVHVDIPSRGPGTFSPGHGLPWGVKVRETIAGHVLDKSYSPVNLVSPHDFEARDNTTLALLVKSYPMQEGGGLGAFICSRQVGDTLSLRVKPETRFHGAPYVPNRWRRLSLIAAGTGIAPLYQLAHGILANPEDRTELTMVFCNRGPEDVLFRTELDLWAATHPETFRVHYVLSQPTEDMAEASMDDFSAGRITDAVIAENIFPPSTDPDPDSGGASHVMVCGQDQFLDTVCGRHVRTRTEEGRKRKQQGPLSGALARLGYTAGSVSKL